VADTREDVSRLAEVKHEWRQRTWLVRVMDWERTRSWERMTMRRRPPSWASSATLAAATSPPPSPLRLTAAHSMPEPTT
jgi:hypothetical protein